MKPPIRFKNQKSGHFEYIKDIDSYRNNKNENIKPEECYFLGLKCLELQNLNFMFILHHSSHFLANTMPKRSKGIHTDFSSMVSLL